MRLAFPDARLVILAGAVLLLGGALSRPQVAVEQAGFDLLAIVDITGSMNVRDYSDNGRPVSRLEAVKKALAVMAAQLPCPSKMALGIFAERQSFLLFEPIDICVNYAPVEGAIAMLDWRMAWEGDSRVAAGLYRAIDHARALKTDLVFFTDGQEAPPLPASGGPAFEGQPGVVRGLVVGVGGYELSPIPKFDDRGREIGFFGQDDVPHESRFGLPPKGAEQRDGFNARNAPFGADVAVGSEHLSSVREPYLQDLAGKAGLAYARLVDGEDLLKKYLAAGSLHARPSSRDLSPWLAGCASAALVTLYLIPLLFELLSKRRKSTMPGGRVQPRRRK